MSLPKMRTLPEAIAELKALDENTALTLTALRRKVKTGEIPSVAVGCKRLVCMETLIEYLSHPEQFTPLPERESGKIRRIG